MTPGDLTLVIGCGALVLGFVLGVGATAFAFARDRRVVTLQPGQVVMTEDDVEKIKAIGAASVRNSLRNDPAATVPRRHDVEHDFGDDDDEDLDD